MFRPRIIPVLLLKNLGLVKSIRFKKFRYIGDPINAVKIFNDKKADELIFLDINASREKRCIPLDFVHKVGDEANMPFGVGGGIRTLDQIRQILKHGAEKVVLNTIAAENPDFVRQAAEEFGSSTIVVCIDVKKNLFGRYTTVFLNGKKKLKYSPVEFAQLMEEKGAGEIVIQSVDRDGTYLGYDLDLITMVSRAVSIPVVALGGANDYEDFRKAHFEAIASAVAAGSLFVYHGPRRAVLINYEHNYIFSK
ncbi:imidazole glycerol phosphate synthase subunit HisF [Melioribacter roseus P3M-2]|uniref:imidazole glycerol-phosphate synthase n=1 Tax=Melioribacter roseus (strain DSM 23840 / JCM 17771 / VKM B-2668 / P3M-2) TaxID=1191523 RepID=I6Z9V1_MELRP|nr:AglZ/HisF2 family acetamidino modification protein [Melioribacter roseus]AFN75905.1 imidazole glycerol phosphate synthase subunit HisF [Melioribacter roseus P3M-2]